MENITDGTKFCHNCGEKIDAKAEICPNCGVRVKASTTGAKNPGLAAVLSFFFMGLGQIYNGDIGKGILFIILYVISILLWVVLIGFLTTPILWIYGVYDAYKTAEKINAGEIVTL